MEAAGQPAWTHCLNMGPERMINLVAFKALFPSTFFFLNLCFLLYFLAYSFLLFYLMICWAFILPLQSKLHVFRKLSLGTSPSGGLVPFYRHAHGGLEGGITCPGTQIGNITELRFQTSLGVSVVFSPEAAQPAGCWAAGWMWGQTRERSWNPEGTENRLIRFPFCFLHY